MFFTILNDMDFFMDESFIDGMKLSLLEVFSALLIAFTNY